jgi:hypothetical protein
MIGFFFPLAAAASTPDPQFARIRDDIVRHCTTRHAASAARDACLLTQRRSLKQFLGIAVFYRVPNGAEELCMRLALTPNRTVDWQRARQCLFAKRLNSRLKSP